MQVLQLLLPLLARIGAGHAAYQPLCYLCTLLGVKLLMYAFKCPATIAPANTIANEIVNSIADLAAAASAPQPQLPGATFAVLQKTFSRNAAPSALPWAPPEGKPSALQPQSFLATVQLTAPAASALLGWHVHLLAFAYAHNTCAFAPLVPALLDCLSSALDVAPLSALAPPCRVMAMLTQQRYTAGATCAHVAASQYLSASAALLAPPASSADDWPKDVTTGAAETALALTDAMTQRGLLRLVDIRAALLPAVLLALQRECSSVSSSGVPSQHGSAPQSDQPAHAANRKHPRSSKTLLLLARKLLCATDTAQTLFDELNRLPQSVLEDLASSSGERQSWGPKGAVSAAECARPRAAMQQAQAQAEAYHAAAEPAIKRARTSHNSDTENADHSNGNAPVPAHPGVKPQAPCDSDTNQALDAQVAGGSGRWASDIVAWQCLSWEEKAEHVQHTACALLCFAALVRCRCPAGDSRPLPLPASLQVNVFVW